MNKYLVMSAALALVACSTPQQTCIGQVSRDLRVVDQLIAESEANLSRGYAIVEVERTRPAFVDCTPPPSKDDPDPRPRKCWQDVVETVKRPMAIDLDAEASKLASLRKKRAELDQRTAAGILACQRQYPE